MRYVIRIGILVVFLVGIWQCVVNKLGRSAAESDVKEIKATLSATKREYQEYRNRSDSALNNATATAIQAGDSAKKSQAALDQARGKIKGLLNMLCVVDNSHPDSSYVLVNPAYKMGCDSLRQVTAIQDELINQYEQDNQAHVNALGYETSIRDSALQKEREFSNAFRQQLLFCSDALGKASVPGKTQLYAGMAAWGNAINPLGGGEINLGLKTKRDQFYEIKGAYLGTWWVGIGTKFKISLK